MRGEIFVRGGGVRKGWSGTMDGAKGAEGGAENRVAGVQVDCCGWGGLVRFSRVDGFCGWV